MGYRSLRECVNDLERHGQLRRIDAEIDPRLEMAEIHRRVYQAKGPALYFSRPTGCAFPMVSNLFGTLDRTRFLFRDTIAAVKKLVELKVDPSAFWKKPWRYLGLPATLWCGLPKVVRRAPVLAHETTISKLPHLVCWPKDGGAFVTLPAVYSEDADRPGWRSSNLGMYRVQLTGNQFNDERIGLHYQIHRGIGVHHAAALRKGVPFHVNVAVGGPPALSLAAVMPLPEGMPEVAFAGLLGGRRVRLVHPPLTPPRPPSPTQGRGGEQGSGGGGGSGTSGSPSRRGRGAGERAPWGVRGKWPLPMPADADFVIAGTVDPLLQLPEGPFGDHLGYYSLAHDFPVLNVAKVYHRPDAVWPFTVVGRPPQEDTSFGEIIHELTGPVIPTVVGGVHAVHAVDAAGVHPLLLAIGSERYVPYARERSPQELLTCANAILGQGQLSLAKYLLIVANEDNPALDVHDVEAFFAHLLERADWRRDLHFQTRTTIDTLDYSGTGLNEGSKLVIAAAGPRRRELAREIPSRLHLPDGFHSPRLCMPGVLAVQAPPYPAGPQADTPPDVERLTREIGPAEQLSGLPLILLVDDSDFAARHVNNWVWMTFTRSNPAQDVHGVGSWLRQKHFGCDGPLVIDARIKPRHAPPLVEDPAVSRRVDELAAPGGPLHGLY
jgi:4-hydroxy-3-polyprenylbenzoate decarboxylase